MSTVKSIFSSWKEKMTSGSIPSRDHFNPMKLGKNLGYTYILEQTGDDIVYRLAGTEMELVWGQTLSSSNLTSLLQSVDAYNLYHGMIKYAFDHHHGLVFTGTLCDSNDNFTEIEEVALPYQSLSGDSIEMIGVQILSGKLANHMYSHRSVTYIITGVKVIPTAANYNEDDLPEGLKTMMFTQGLTLEVCHEAIA